MIVFPVVFLCKRINLKRIPHKFIINLLSNNIFLSDFSVDFGSVKLIFFIL